MSLLRRIINQKNLLFKNPIKSISTSAFLNKEHRKNKRQNIVVRDLTVPQEQAVAVESAWLQKCEFPDETTNDRLFNGEKFSDIPIAHIRVSKNNTKFQLTPHLRGGYLFRRTCGQEGFKNAKKGTNIAAQTTALGFCKRTLAKGIDQVRVVIWGLGPGRMASIKGLEMGGLNIVSITDMTPYIINGKRPRKARRI